MNHKKNYNNGHYTDSLNIFNYGVTSSFKDIAEDDLLHQIGYTKLKYFHKAGYRNNNIRCDIENIKLFTIDKKFNKLIHKNSLHSNISNIYIKLEIFECSLCNKNRQYRIEFGKELDLGYCPYYENAAKKIQNQFRWKKRLRVLWKIAEYYTKNKFSPENILKHIKLD